MAKGQRFIIVDGYIAELLQQIVDQGKASDLPSAVGKSAASYLGIRYKSKDERRLEQMGTSAIDDARRATKNRPTIDEAMDGF